MTGESEQIFIDENGAAVEICRGKSGAAVVSFSNELCEIALSTTLPDGTYKDEVHNTTFTVSDGTLKGNLEPHASYILYAAE